MYTNQLLSVEEVMVFQDSGALFLKVNTRKGAFKNIYFPFEINESI